MAVYRVLVVDDSAFMRKIVSDLIIRDPSFVIAGTASNGKEAVAKIQELKPDLVTMDVEMPEMNGLEALRLIMEVYPLPVIMLSGINEQGMKETIMALEAGAFDFIRKPSISNSQDIEQVGIALVEQMRTAMHVLNARTERKEENERKALEAAASVSSKKVVPPSLKNDIPGPPFEQSKSYVQKSIAKPDAFKSPQAWQKKNQAEPEKAKERPVVTPKAVRPVTEKKTAKAEGFVLEKPGSEKRIPIPKISQPKPVLPPVPVRNHAVYTNTFTKLVAVGCSTGGPRALKILLERIPADFPAPIVIVQHMPPNFTRSLAQRLNSLSPLKVVEAEHGMILETGTAYIAPGGYQLRVVPGAGGKYMISLSVEEPRNGHRPSVDTMFESLVHLNSLERHLVLLTGMGSDGAKMMKKLYDTGVQSTFAENEETCVVYGMPRSAVELNCVRHLLPLQEIAPKLVQVLK